MNMQHFKRFSGVLALCLAGLAGALSAPARGAYPERTVTIIAGYGAGGGVDTLSRLYADKLSAILGVPFLVQNKPGAGGTLAAAEAARVTPDGYTLMVAPTAVFAITPHVRQVRYAPLTDFKPISTLATGISVVVSSAALPTKHLPEFIALAKANPEAYSCASSGTGTSTHLTCEMFKEAAGINLLHVPYKSSNDYLTDLIQGRVSIAFDPALLNQVQAGQLNLMATISDVRTPEYPDAATTGEAGMDTSLMQSRGVWYGLFAPAGVPDEVVQTLARAVQTAARDPDLIRQLSVTGIRASSLAPEAFATRVKEDSVHYANLIDRLGIKLE